jgi:hypothetical protein
MTLSQIVVRPEDRVAERSWLLEKIAGATGVIVTAFTDKVTVLACGISSSRSSNIKCNCLSRSTKNSLREVGSIHGFSSFRVYYN